MPVNSTDERNSFASEASVYKLFRSPVRGDVSSIRLFREPLELLVAGDHPFA